MKGKDLKVATSDNDVTQETLSERSMGRDAVATIRGVNAIVIEWLNSGDGWVFADVILAIVSAFCDAKVMEGAYDTYRERVLQGLTAGCPQTTEKN
jgi:hypothetical protein